MLTLPPLSLYVHIPWCLKKCPYCDFNSHEYSSALPEKAYVQILLEDLKHDLPYVQDRSLVSVFFGGGTPSLFAPDTIGYFLDECRRLVPFSDEIEITLEANPGTFEQEKFSAFHSTGVNRLSIGIQSFQAAMLTRLGRVHDDREALKAVEIARTAGFDNLNLDLMYGLPDQSTQEALMDLEQAINFQPEHISWYQLTIEPNTVFYRRPPQLPGTELCEDIQDAGVRLLASSGYDRYEISAYSRDHKQALHNMNYWQFGDYLGVGAGAHGKITLPQQGRIIRTRKPRQPRAYLENHRLINKGPAPIAERDLTLEFMMNALRLRHGVSLQLFEERTGLPRQAITAQLDALRIGGLLETQELQPTAHGFNLLNSVLQAFMN